MSNVDWPRGRYEEDSECTSLNPDNLPFIRDNEIRCGIRDAAFFAFEIQGELGVVFKQDECLSAIESFHLADFSSDKSTTTWFWSFTDDVIQILRGDLLSKEGRGGNRNRNKPCEPVSHFFSLTSRACAARSVSLSPRMRRLVELSPSAARRILHQGGGRWGMVGHGGIVAEWSGYEKAQNQCIIPHLVGGRRSEVGLKRF